MLKNLQKKLIAMSLVFVYMLNQMDIEKKAKKEGIDLSLIDANLELSYTNRAILHQKALNLVLELKKAGSTYYERLQNINRSAHNKQR